MGGPTGLDYAAVYPLIDREAEGKQAWDDLFDDVQTLETAALDTLTAKDD